MRKPTRIAIFLTLLLTVIASYAATAAMGTPAAGVTRAGPTYRSDARVGAVRTAKSPSEPGLSLGLSGATNVLTGSAATTWNARGHNVGAQLVRLAVNWSDVAPKTVPAGFDASDPNAAAYNWTGVDRQVKTLTSDGYKIFLAVGDAPSWAEGPIPSNATPAPGTWEPNATDFGQFATAIATRYDGSTDGLPRVSDWQAWNEPNLTEYLAPQWLKSGQTWIPESTTIYRNLENAFYASVKGVLSTNYVVAASTAPYGDPPGGARMQPVTFDQNLLCLDANDHATGGCPGPTSMDAIDDHPYVTGLCCHGPTWHAGLAADTSVADMYKVVAVLRAAESAGTVAPTGTKGVWATEVGWNTDPPNPNANEASPAAQVARWADQALYVLWSQGVNTVMWYQLADDPESSSGWGSTYTEGLYYNSGAVKPEAQAFRFPFLTNRKSKRLISAWGRSPKAGTVWIQQKSSSGRWTSIVKLKVKADQVFQIPLTFAGTGSFRAVVGGTYSMAWSQSA